MEKRIYITFYAFWIFNYVLYQMIREEDCFHGWQDFKDFLSAWKNQVRQKRKTLNNLTQ